MKPINWNDILGSRDFWRADFGRMDDDWWKYDEFWLRYLGLFNEDDPEEINSEDLPEITLRVPFPEDFALEWQMVKWDSIYLIHPSRDEPILLGWLDGNFENDVFKISERNMIVEIAAQNWQSDFDFKYFPLLFYKYSRLTTDEEFRQMKTVVKRDWIDSGIFTHEDIEKYSFLEVFNDLKWIEDEKYRWLAEGGYSLRDVEAEDRTPSLVLNDFFAMLERHSNH